MASNYPEHGIPCPWCHAPTGQRCTVPTGRKLPIPSHDARLHAWRQQTGPTEERAS